ncbi:MAG: hypothetical protein V3W44_09590 [Dehalococcoidales bacterium]
MGHEVLSNVEFIHPNDTAIIEEQSDYSAYARSNYRDRSKLKFLPGLEPTVFVIKQLSHRQKLQRSMYELGFQREEYTVRCGLVRVRGFAGGLPDMVKVKEGDSGMIIGRQWMDDANLGELVITGCAQAIFKISELSLTPPLSELCDTQPGPTESQSPAEENSAK